uniref:OTU domain-containing protein n=1 Tax=Lactuca sativa TaxID=4236 RepID=A0A9R1V8F4_LACSA|nr:hypothetical protein LSAT_V11C600320620 [Lactuca sativa]
MENSSPSVASEPAVRTNTHGRPRASTKPSEEKPLVPPTQDPRRGSFYSYTPDYMGFNMFDLNQQSELERHNTYSFGESSMFNQEPMYQRSYFEHAFIDEIPSEFQPYVSHIQIVEEDGHCGLQAIVVALGFSEEYWYQIRTNLYRELLMHIDDYKVYGVIVHFLSKDESSTSFPLWSGPQDFPNHPIINIALLNGYHYIKVDLQEGHPMGRDKDTH